MKHPYKNSTFKRFYFNKIFMGILLLMFCQANFVLAQVTPTDGDWAEKYVTLFNTPEAELMSRTGDIDNLNFGWPPGFDPFSGNNTPVHSFPWAIDTTDPGGTDRIMVITSYNGNPPFGRDGYTSSTSRPDNNVQPIVLTFPYNSVAPVNAAILQMFVDDFQAPLWGASYEVYFDGIRIPSLESIINGLLQTGPIGKIISMDIPNQYLHLLQDDTLSILIDDFTTGAGDGYAIDFAKILLNPIGAIQTGVITGVVTDINTALPIEGVRVVANGLVEDTTDVNGNYTIENVLAGIVSVQTYKQGYGSEIQTINLVAGNTATLNFQLNSPAPEVLLVSPADQETDVPLNASIYVYFSQAMDTTTINSSTFILSDTTATLNGTFTKTDSSFTFTPSIPLTPENDYIATILNSVKNQIGVNLAEDYNWTFSTRLSAAITSAPSLAPEGIWLKQNYPNPFNPTTTIGYAIQKPGFVQITIYNELGQLVRTLVNEDKPLGEYSVFWAGRNNQGQLVTSGVYFYTLEVGRNTRIAKRMVIIK